MSGPWSVTRIDMAHYQTPEGENEAGRYPSFDAAQKVALDILRRSLLDLRTKNQSAAALNKLWWIYGDDAFVHGPDGQSWRASTELDAMTASL